MIVSYKVTEALGTETKTVSKIELDLSGIPKDKQDDVKDQIGDFLVEQILSTVSKAKSPVQGEAFEKLSPNYLKKKEKLHQPGKPNMELSGDMLDALTFKQSDEGIEVGFFNEQAWKADGHLKFSGEKSNNPKRRFLPGEDQKFLDPITKQVDKIIQDAIAENTDINKNDFKNIETKEDLYTKLEVLLGDYTESELRLIVYRSEDIFSILDDLDLLGLL